MPNQFVWYELMTTDPDAAKAFYGAVVGWTFEEAQGLHGSYTILKAGETRVAGLMALPPEAQAAKAPPSWIGYIGVADLDTEVKRLTDAGGQLYRPAAEIGVGRFAVVADPGGAAFVLFQPSPTTEPPVPPAPGTPGTIGWHELYAADGAAALAFYASLYGWTEDRALDMGPMGTYRLFAAGGDAVGGIMTKPPFVPRPFWGFYVNVPALDAASAVVTGEGGAVTHGPTEVPGGSWIIQCTDPQGAAFALVAPGR